ncbi:M48 family metallopeptidase [Pedobacter foliorum]|uniref:M48 family metallopeptidase n=1 Tax=Pedobacter foliorum TaxID=2739058 RepID=UPI0015677A96|nr:M48 family metallopeptidase [Pedobacter foliorum]NRF37417.1 M48 family metallopeptidase [Pedobacter foliorum]
MKTLKCIPYVLAVLLFNPSCRTVPITGRKQINLVPDVLIREMAFTQYDQVIKQSKTLSKDDELAKLVTKVGLKIQLAVETYLNANNMPKEVKKMQWAFNTVDENIVNAWCMPGGKVVVYTGLLPVAQSETGLAVVMGHEIAHAIARHGNERMSESVLVSLGGMAIQEALKEKKHETQALFLGLYMIGSHLTVSLPNNRKQESEADKLGLIFMSMAGYNPEEAVPFWQRMSAVQKTKTPEFLSTHPSDENRIKKLSALIPEVKAQYYKSP